MKIFKIALLMAIMPFLSSLNAAAVTWNGSQDSDWENDNNWTPASYPSYSDDVVIPVTGNNPPGWRKSSVLIQNQLQLKMWKSRFLQVQSN